MAQASTVITCNVLYVCQIFAFVWRYFYTQEQDNLVLPIASTEWTCSYYLLTLRFFFKFFSRAYCSKIHRPNESTKKKNVDLEKFLNKTTLKPLDFWAGEARMRGCLNITSAQKWHAVIFQISAEKKFPGLKKEISCTYWMNLEVLPHDFLQITTPKVVQKC